ncbi:MAG: MFS transporter [bacterium]|nr:MFS transporter [bacterium]
MPQLTREEQFIISESPELQSEEASGWLKKIAAVFPALKSRNYRLYFSGQIISLIGTWLQIVAQGWLVLKLTDSAFYVGLTAAASFLPSLLFSLFGGVIVDRFPKRSILLATQCSSMLLALTLGLLTLFNIISLAQILILAFLLGCVTAVDSPALQSFAVELVGKKNLTSAIALNSGIFNAARVIGPALAGFLIALIGLGGAFIINGLSYLAIIIALLYIKTGAAPARRQLKTFVAIKQGVSYSWQHPIIRSLLVFTGIVSVFGWSYGTILPVITKNTFHMEAAGLGYLYAAAGLGSLAAAILLSALSKKINHFIFILGGNIMFAAAIVLFSLSQNFIFALFSLFLAGFGLVMAFATINSTIQNLVDDQYRGRVVSIYTLVFLGLAPLGNLQIGYLAERFGAGPAMQTGSLIVFCATAVLLLYRPRITAAFQSYNNK